jgi:hypothetical protein
MPGLPAGQQAQRGQLPCADPEDKVAARDNRQVLSLVMFTVPVVILGAQLGSALAGRIPQRLLERSPGVLFVVVAFLTPGVVVP